PIVDRRMPIVADDYVDPEFGTGCVKITPAHDFNDYELGRRHDLPMYNIFDDNAAINDTAPAPYRGLDRFDAREKIVAELDALGLVERIEDYVCKIPRGDRSGAVVEPYLTDQWYVSIKPLAEPAIKAVETGRIRFVPENWSKTYYEWMHNIQDWCISRQLWWGHRIPAWYDSDGNIYVGRDEADARAKNELADSVELRQDEDVLDTWFSSALWPFSTQGWPQQTEDLKTFYPGQVLVTGFDIIFFWVARMIMMGLKFMGDVPFHEVYIHGLIRDQDGQKMSKSKGNVLDPLDLIDGVDLETLLEKRTSGLMQDHLRPAIEKATRKQFPHGIDEFGADALRFTFASLATTGRDIRFDLGRIDGYSNFCNKLWNAANYVLMNTDELDDGDACYGPADRWIRSRLDRAVGSVREHLDNYRLDLAAQVMYDFTWYEFCAWYLELSKPVLQSDESSPEEKRGTRRTLIEVQETLLRLLHPLMPFITEEIWGHVAPRAGVTGDTIMLQAFPESSPANRDAQAEQELDWVMRFILGIRQIRGEMDIAPGKPLPVIMENATAQDTELANQHAALLKRVGRVDSISLLQAGETAPPAATALHGEMRLLVPMQGLIDVDAERQRLAKQKEKILIDLERSRNKLANANFVNNAPPDVVSQESRRAEEFQSQLSQIDEQIARLASFI
ncbi:MAG: valine--tRNA ligase, partial [Gammaproteobacteria bacterium]|nr:valine--tRNA ligase [Gammaproteobacteria bacterium]